MLIDLCAGEHDCQALKVAQDERGKREVEKRCMETEDKGIGDEQRANDAARLAGIEMEIEEAPEASDADGDGENRVCLQV